MRTTAFTNYSTLSFSHGGQQSSAVSQPFAVAAKSDPDNFNHPLAVDNHNNVKSPQVRNANGAVAIWGSHVKAILTNTTILQQITMTYKLFITVIINIMVQG